MQPTLSGGTTLARYRVIERLGAGGMGEVYRAEDTTLDRQVALKILPPEVVAREDRVRRFVQEAKAASGLSHPNIITIHEIGQATIDSDAGNGGDASAVHFIAMELIDGETLRQKIYAPKRNLKTILGYLAQAADGLAKAHAAGIIHRDLKPDNVMVTRDGFAKVLDFGLAKLTERSASDGHTGAPTALREETREGMILGSLGYMAPEQVEGKPVDARADIFSFGCILYEVVTGRKPFTGKSDVDILHSILHSEPDPVAELAPDAPGELRRMLRRCLAKDPDQRYQSMKDIAIELRDLVEEFDQLSPSSGSRSSPELAALGLPSRSRNLLLFTIALIVLAAAAVVGYLGSRRSGAVAPAAITVTALTSHGNAMGGKISPDGRYLAYGQEHRGKRGLYLKQTATGSEVAILPPASDLRIRGVAFSHDGNYLYVTSGRIGDPINSATVVPSLGGAPRILLNDVDSAVALAPDENALAFVRQEPAPVASHLVTDSTRGGMEKIIATRSKVEFFRSSDPAWSPDGEWIAAIAGSSEGGMHYTILLFSPDGKETRDLLEGRIWFEFTSIAWLPDGSGLVATGQEFESPFQQLWLVSFPGGQTRRLTNDLNTYSSVSVTADGKAIVAAQEDGRSRLWKITPEGAAPLTSESERFGPRQVRLLPDGSAVYQSLETGNLDVWRLFPNGERRQLTSDPKADYAPLASPDGRVFFQTERSGDSEFWVMSADGAGQKKIATVGADVDTGISPDGKRLVYFLHNALYALSTENGERRQLAPYGGRSPRYSPDGRWIAAFVRPENQLKLMIMPAEGGPTREIAEIPPTANREDLRWTPDGKGVAYARSDEGVPSIWVQPVDGGEPRQVARFDDGWIFDFAWSKEGELYVTRSTARADVIMIRDFR